MQMLTRRLLARHRDFEVTITLGANDIRRYTRDPKVLEPFLEAERGRYLRQLPSREPADPDPNMSATARAAAAALAIQDITDEYHDNDAVVIIAAAGNFRDTTPVLAAPASLSRSGPALVETEDVENGNAANRTGRFEPAEWSSKGDHVDFWTVAEGVRSTFVTGYESPVFDNSPAVFPQDAWALWSGTSFAAPQIAGAVARICHERGKTPREAVEILKDRGAPTEGQRGKQCGSCLASSDTRHPTEARWRVTLIC